MTILRPAALDALQRVARDCADAERAFRESYVREMARLETERRRAVRRYNFLAALVVADALASDREASRSAQRTAALDELDWSEGEKAAADLMEALTPLADAIHDERDLARGADEALPPEDPYAPIPVSATEANPAEAREAAILFALAAFEQRFEALRGEPLADVFDRARPDTPLVDV